MDRREQEEVRTRFLPIFTDLGVQTLLVRQGRTGRSSDWKCFIRIRLGRERKKKMGFKGKTFVGRCVKGLKGQR